MKLNNPIAAAAIIFLLGGCGNWDAIYRKHNFASNESAITDIKSRAIITTKTISTYNSDGSLKSTTAQPVCAEPSPDAITAYAAELAADGSSPSGNTLGVAGSYQGAAAFVGMRTQTIQLLRDQLYRLCEAKINGWITADHYEMLLTRNQRYTLALMAIENLAQASQAPTVTLTSQSSAESYTNFKASENLLNSAKKEKADLEKVEKDKIKPEQTARLAELEQEIPILEERVKNTKSALASGSTSANISLQGTAPKTNQDGIDAIKSITETLITQGEDGYKCYYASLDSSPNPTGAKKALDDYCEQYFKSRKELLANFMNSQKDSQGKPIPLPPATILNIIKQL